MPTTPVVEADWAYHSTFEQAVKAFTVMVVGHWAGNTPRDDATCPPEAVGADKATQQRLCIPIKIYDFAVTKGVRGGIRAGTTIHIGQLPASAYADAPESGPVGLASSGTELLFLRGTDASGIYGSLAPQAVAVQDSANPDLYQTAWGPKTIKQVQTAIEQVG